MKKWFPNFSRKVKSEESEESDIINLSYLLGISKDKLDDIAKSTAKDYLSKVMGISIEKLDREKRILWDDFEKRIMRREGGSSSSPISSP